MYFNSHFYCLFRILALPAKTFDHPGRLYGKPVDLPSGRQVCCQIAVRMANLTIRHKIGQQRSILIVILDN